MTFLEIEFGSDAYRQECELRHNLLRAPFGLSLYEENLNQERQQMHFGLFERDELIACVIAVPLSPTEAKIRQMVVGTEWQRRGCGRKLLQNLEAHLAGRGFIHLFMHARLAAAGFYEKLGYSRTGADFIELGISHVKMEKRLASANLAGEKSGAGVEQQSNKGTKPRSG